MEIGFFYENYFVDNALLTGSFVFYNIIIVMYIALAKNTIFQFTLFFMLLLVAASFSLSRVFYRIIN
jgi:hypothetical protein